METTTLPDCFTYLPGVLADLKIEDFENLAWEEKTLSMFGKTFNLPRLTAMYGAAYTYSGVHHPARPFPSLLEAVRARVETLSNLEGFVNRKRAKESEAAK